MVRRPLARVRPRAGPSTRPLRPVPIGLTVRAQARMARARKGLEMRNRSRSPRAGTSRALAVPAPPIRARPVKTGALASQTADPTVKRSRQRNKPTRRRSSQRSSVSPARARLGGVRSRLRSARTRTTTKTLDDRSTNGGLFLTAPHQSVCPHWTAGRDLDNSSGQRPSAPKSTSESSRTALDASPGYRVPHRQETGSTSAIVHRATSASSTGTSSDLQQTSLSAAKSFCESATSM